MARPSTQARELTLEKEYRHMEDDLILQMNTSVAKLNTKKLIGQLLHDSIPGVFLLSETISSLNFEGRPLINIHQI